MGKKPRRVCIIFYIILSVCWQWCNIHIEDYIYTLSLLANDTKAHQFSMALSSGYITEFDHATGSGLIEEAATKRILSVHLNDIKQRSRRYLTEKNEFIGELFDFDLITKQDVNGEDTFEAKNVRRRALYCPMKDCSRLKAFTNKKALDDHINIRHILKEEKRQSSSSSSIVVDELLKKKRHVRSKPELICLSYDTTDAVIGRFIGKQGVNIKRFEQQYQVRIQLLDKKKRSQSIQIRIKPISHATFDIESVTKQLKLQWERCTNFQKLQEQLFSQRLSFKSWRKENRSFPSSEIEGDSRRAGHFKFLQTKRSKMQKLIQQSKQHQTVEYMQYHWHKSEKPKKEMKNHQWKVNEQLLGFA